MDNVSDQHVTYDTMGDNDNTDNTELHKAVFSNDLPALSALLRAAKDKKVKYIFDIFPVKYLQFQSLLWNGYFL